MKKWLIDHILIFIILSTVILFGLFTYITFYLCDEFLRKYFSDLLLSLLTGFVLALGVYMTGVHLEENRIREAKKTILIEKFGILKNLLKNVFSRAKTNWNFSNRTPTFYFDNDWINPLYDLLTQNNREWDVFLQEYTKIVGSNKLIEKLIKFITNIDIALINTESIDTSLKFKKLAPELSASMSSGYPTERLEAKKNSEFAFWIIRGSWAGANSTEIMFGIAFFTDQQLIMQRIEGLIIEAKSLAENIIFDKLIKKYSKDKKNLSNLISDIKKLV